MGYVNEAMVHARQIHGLRTPVKGLELGRKKKRISVQSAKAKGRKLQQWVRGQILDLFPTLTKDDVYSRSMGAGGSDVYMSKEARGMFPYEIECKAQEKYKGIYDIMEQAKGHGDMEPIGFIKMKRKEPLVIMRANHFFNLKFLQYQHELIVYPQ